MEYLTELVTTVPEGTSPAKVDERYWAICHSEEEMKRHRMYLSYEESNNFRYGWSPH
jgi:hypothetical protein